MGLTFKAKAHFAALSNGGSMVRRVCSAILASGFAASAMLFTGSASAAEVLHYDPGGNAFLTHRGAGSAPFGRLTVDNPITVYQIGSLVDLNGDQNMQFLIFDAVSGANLFTSTIQAFLDDGLEYKWSDPLSFTFTPGITYSVGATSSVGGSFAVDYISNSVGGFNFLTGNQNSNGVFGNTTLNTGQNCCDVATAFRTSLVNGAVPEPSTWAMMLLGFGFVGGAMRAAKRRQKLALSYA
jgi:hypothetical protein